LSTLKTISTRLKHLSEIPDKKEMIFLEDVRKEFRKDLEQFIYGETLMVVEGKPVIGKNLYRSWLRKLKINGFDYDIKHH